MYFVLTLMYLFLWVVYVRGRHYDLCLVFLLLPISYMVHWLLIYIMRLFMVYVFMFCEIKKFTLVYLYFLHMHLCIYLVFQEFIG